MLSKKVYGNIKNAGITIEITLSLALTVVVLFLLLGLFSDNIQTMAAGTGMQNLFNRDNEFAQTSMTKLAFDPTGTQVNVQIVADHGLEEIHLAAQAVIERLAALDNLTPAQIMELAQSLTVYCESGNIAPDYELVTYKPLAHKYGIEILFNRHLTIINSNSTTPTVVNWNDPSNIITDARTESNENIRIRNVIYIQNVFKRFNAQDTIISSD
ncbi:MAG: hypothetical protein PHC64_08560 [Candidatus Gastranaerophilales bacterium]|nr:hypothetical protein [Candidatus Gastranaerophilales bacterium]